MDLKLQHRGITGTSSPSKRTICLAAKASLIQETSDFHSSVLPTGRGKADRCGITEFKDSGSLWRQRSWEGCPISFACYSLKLSKGPAWDLEHSDRASGGVTTPVRWHTQWSRVLPILHFRAKMSPAVKQQFHSSCCKWGTLEQVKVWPTATTFIPRLLRRGSIVCWIVWKLGEQRITNAHIKTPQATASFIWFPSPPPFIRKISSIELLHWNVSILSAFAMWTESAHTSST